MARRAETTTIPQIAADLARQAGVDIVSHIGSGSLGEVFRASVNRRTVALKVFHPDASVDVSVLERFVQGRDAEFKFSQRSQGKQVGSRIFGSQNLCAILV